jgi:hypothetical protein
LTGDDRVTLVRADRGISPYENASGRLRWSDEEFPWSDAETLIQGERLVAYAQSCGRGPECHVRRYDLRSGRMDRAPHGEYAGSGQGLGPGLAAVGNAVRRT